MFNMVKQTFTDEKTILSLLDVIGSCITDVFYNHLHDRAIAVHEKTSRGIAESYRQAIYDYVQESTSPKFYSVLLNSIHHYTRMSTVYHDLSYVDCISLYSGLFVPHMYVNSMTIEQRVNIVSMVLGNVVKAFSTEIIQQHIAVIVDDHSDPINIEILQDNILKILINERNNSYDRFIDSQKKSPGAQSNKKVAIVNIPKTKTNTKVIAKLMDEYKKSISDRSALKSKIRSCLRKTRLLVNSLKR